METITISQDTTRQRSELKSIESHTCVDDDDDEDETLKERLIGLTEMFPPRVCTAVCHLSSLLTSGTVVLFQLSKKMTWVIATSAAILVLPVMFETERAQLEEQQLQQQRQILLGPTAAVAGGQSLMPGLMQMPQPQKS